MILNLFARPQSRWPVAFSTLLLVVVGVEWAVVHSVAFGRKPDMLSLGVTLDVVLGIPLAYYFMVVRRAGISRATVLAVVLLSGLLAGVILPAAHHRYLGYWERVMALAEVGVLVGVAIKGRTVMRDFRALQQQMPDFIGNLQRSLTPVIDNAPLAAALVGEVSVLRYSLFGWVGGIEKTADQRAYTTYRESGQIALTGALLAIILIETAAIHLVVARSYPGAAWLLTAVSLYSLLFLVADTVALIKRPLLIDQGRVLLRLGLRGQGSFPISAVDRVVTVTEAPPKNRATLNGCFLSTPNLLITCRQPIPIAGPFGIRREVQRIALFCRRPRRFCSGTDLLCGVNATRFGIKTTLHFRRILTAGGSVSPGNLQQVAASAHSARRQCAFFCQKSDRAGVVIALLKEIRQKRRQYKGEPFSHYLCALLFR